MVEVVGLHQWETAVIDSRGSSSCHNWPVKSLKYGCSSQLCTSHLCKVLPLPHQRQGITCEIPSSSAFCSCLLLWASCVFLSDRWAVSYEHLSQPGVLLWLLAWKTDTPVLAGLVLDEICFPGLYGYLLAVLTWQRDRAANSALSSSGTQVPSRDPTFMIFSYPMCPSCWWSQLWHVTLGTLRQW